MPDMSETPNFMKMNVAEKTAYFKEKQRELVELEARYKKASDINKAELQMAFGLTPGKPVSIVDLVSIVAELVGETVKPGDLSLANKDSVDALSTY